jgi:dTMP kinase
MSESQGKLIVFDGNDGAGKKTQSKLLIAHLESQGKKIKTIDFPRYYDNFFGGFIADAQCGDYGDFVNLHPRYASVLYAADRFETAPQIRRWLEEGYMVLADRYATANMIHQGGKVSDEKEREDFISWLENMEFEVFKIPRPDVVIYMDVPVEVSMDNIKTKEEDYMKGRKDQTEHDVDYASNSRAAALWLCERYDSWHTVVCATDKGMRSAEEISADVIGIIEQKT